MNSVRATAATTALEEVRDALNQLITVVGNGGLDHCNTAELVGCLQGLEQVRHQMRLVDHRLLIEATARDLAVSHDVVPAETGRGRGY